MDAGASGGRKKNFWGAEKETNDRLVIDARDLSDGLTDCIITNTHKQKRTSMTDVLVEEVPVTGGSRRLEIIFAATFGLLGIGLLVPWNAFISAKPYFQARACSRTTHTSLGGNLELWFSLVYTTSSTLSLGCLITFQYLRDRFKKQPSSDTDPEPINNMAEGLVPVAQERQDKAEKTPFWSVVIPLSIYLSVFLLTAVLVFFPDIPRAVFLTVTLLGLSACGSMVSLASSGIVANANMFPAHIGVSPHFQGQAMGGVAVSLANFIVAVVEDPSAFREHQCRGDAEWDLLEQQENQTCQPYQQTDWGTFLYFAVGCLLLVACVAGFTSIHRIQTRADYIPLQSIQDTQEEEAKDTPVDTKLSIRDEGIEASENDDELETVNSLTLEEVNRTPEFPSSENSATTTTAFVWSRVRTIWLAVFLNFVVTLSLFPSWTSTLKSVHRCSSHWRVFNDLYVPMTFLLFNVSDLAGRFLAAAVPIEAIPNLPTKLVGLGVARTVFHVLLGLCPVDTIGVRLPPIHSDIFSFAVQILFGVSNGFLLALSFMCLPSLLPSTPNMQERGSEFMNFAINFGLLSGSLSSFVYSAIAVQH